MVNTQIIPTATAGQRLDRWLKQKYPAVTYGSLQKWLRTGQIRINGKRVKGSVLLKAGDTLRLPPQVESVTPKPLMQTTYINQETLELLRRQIIYEDDDCCVINKPVGLAVQGGTDMKDYVDLYLKDLLPHNEEPLRLTHRLDKDTSGVLLLAKSYASARYFTGLFKQGSIHKRYLALVVGQPKEEAGLITAPVHKKTDSSIENNMIKEKEAETEYRVLARGKQGISLLELCPKTGRTHQLRIHCALSLGCPILGDGKYGGKRAQPFDKRMNIHLHAFQMEVPLQSGRSESFVASVPIHFEQTLMQLFDENIHSKLK